jgi:microcystin-dependent protein
VGQPYIGEVKLISWNYAPRGWAFCNGALMAINQNQALFVILGTTYGGNGQTTFALPDLRGRAALHMGSGFNTGNVGGEESHTLIKSEMPAHNHFVNASDTQGNQNTVQGNILAREVGNPYGGYPAGPSITTLAPDTITNTGGSQPHENRQPYLVINFIIALQGIFPSRN